MRNLPMLWMMVLEIKILDLSNQKMQKRRDGV